MASEETWWQSYRRRQLNRLSVEMILRKSVADTFKEYTDQCSIAGVRKICEADLRLQSRLIWTIFTSVMFGITCYFLFHVWSETLTKPLVVTMDSSTYPITDIDFPAVAICNMNRISKKALVKFAIESYSSLAKHNQSFEEVLNFLLQMGRLLDYSWVEDLRKHPFLEEIGKDSEKVVEQMKMLAPNCSEMLVACSWDGLVVNCSDIFAVRRTVRGHCCAFNFILDYESAGRPNRTILDVKRQTAAGFIKGLNVILDPKLDDYSYPITHVPGFEIFLFDPTHFADPSGGRVIHRIIEPNQTVMLELLSVTQIAAKEVRKYPLSTRKCLFHDEKDQFGEMYSFSACIVNCRIRTVQSLCKCTPYFLAGANDKEATCTLDHLSCLNKYKEKLLYLYPQGAESFEGLETEVQASLYCPECLPDCEFTQHFTKAFKMPTTLRVSQLNEFANKQIVNLFSKYMNASNRCYVSVYQSTDYGILDRLDVISYWFEIISNIGGFAGIFVGFSFVALVEIIYFVFIRLPRILYKNYNEFH